MKILFVMLQMGEEGQGGGMYVDLAQEFVRNGHELTVMAPDNGHSKTYCRNERGMRVVRVNSKRTQGEPNMIKKGVAMALLPTYFKMAYKKHLKGESFDWILMPTPSITLSSFVAYAKRKSGAKFYLILRDIHPQSIASIGLLNNKLMYNYLDRAARIGYAEADLIGCMSQGNIEFVLSQYQYLERNKFVVLYNWLKSSVMPDVQDVRSKYGLQHKFVVLFGGTIGKGQRIENILFLAEHYKDKVDIVFLIVGKGVEKQRLIKTAHAQNLTNMLFLEYMPQQDYLNLVRSADLGLVSISERYGVPTCPSKAVSYMSLGVPILAMINPNSDYGEIIEQAGAGYWSVGSDRERVVELFDKLYADASLRVSMRDAGKEFYCKNCSESVAYATMTEQMQRI